MKNLNLSIPNPCTENWSGFTTTNTGAFCDACSTAVIDFTKMSDAEIVTYFSRNSSHVCGQFHSQQLKIYSSRMKPAIRPGFKLLKAGLMVLVLGLASQSGFANTDFTRLRQSPTQQMITLDVEQIVKGVVKSEDGSVMPGVNIYLKNGNEGTVSDENGKFEFPKKLETGDVLIFSFIGYEKVEYIVLDELNEPIEITMIFDSGMIMGKVAVDEVYAEPTHGIQKVWLKIKSIF